MTDLVNEESTLRDRDVTLTISATGPMRETNHMLQDAISMQRFLYAVKNIGESKPSGTDSTFQAAPAPTELSQVEPMARKIYQFMINGKPYERACLRSVPFPYMSGRGRIMDKDGPQLEGSIGERSHYSHWQHAAGSIQVGHDLSHAPYRDIVRLLEREAEHSKVQTAVVPELKDIILLPRGTQLEPTTQSGDPYENQVGNSILFNLASQFVTSTSNTPERRVRAALSVIQGLDDADVMVPAALAAGGTAATVVPQRPRFLVRETDANGSVQWKALSVAEALEFVNAFVFEVWLEKETPWLAVGENVPEPDSSIPIREPNERDVLFGRGGLTNSWSGNVFYRDVIALHRADYIRAIKMDKPAVARKIVRAIRMGKPPGRFLRKGEDGLWYDVGDKVAAEKTSQGLRERSNMEKRQRSELRKALRIRKSDLEDDCTDPQAKRQKLVDAASIAPTLNYVGTSVAVPLSLSMAHVVALPKRTSSGKGKDVGGLVTDGLPPNAVDSEGNILVTNYDILCGRGGQSNWHRGNIRFRDIVALHRPDYIRASKIQKPSVARVIVRAIRTGDPPGRFLKKDEKTGKWYDIGDKKAAEKTSQALREKQDDVHQSHVHPGSLGMLLPNPGGYLPGTAATVMGNLLAASAESASAEAPKALEPVVQAESGYAAEETLVDPEAAQVETAGNGETVPTAATTGDRGMIVDDVSV